MLVRGKYMSSNANKKYHSIVPPSSSTEKDTVKLLLDIQQKINGSPALNGGFDTLLYKVDKIEESQGKIVSRIDEIHESIYDPDKGIFARISAAKSSQDKDYSEIDKKLVELNTWKNQIEKDSIDEKTSSKEISKKLDDQQKNIESINKWKEAVSSAGRAILVGFGGSVMALIGKFAYDYITVHWKLKCSKMQSMIDCIYSKQDISINTNEICNELINILNNVKNNVYNGIKYKSSIQTITQLFYNIKCNSRLGPELVCDFQ